MYSPSLVFVGRKGPTPNWKMLSQLHPDYHELIYVVNGKLEARMRDRVLIGAPGDVLHYPAGVFHSERGIGGPVFESLFIGFKEPNVAGWPLMQHDRDGRVGVLAAWIDEANAAHDSHLVMLLLESVLHEYARLATEHEVEGISLAKRYAQEHLAEPLQLEDLAAAAGLSRFHFAHLFRKSTGMSPMRYLRNLRVQQARMLLHTTDWPLKTIAAHTGFPDAYKLSRTFKQVTGHAPGALR